MRKNAVYPSGKYRKFPTYPKEDRICHKQFRSKLVRAFDIQHTSVNQSCHNLRMQEEKAGQVCPKVIGIVCMTSLSNLPLQIKRQESKYLYKFNFPKADQTRG
jgi:hypothetical protein